jgi:hypothetical protein
MGSRETTTSAAGSRNGLGAAGAAAGIKPLPWPPAGASRRRALAPHAHRCAGCAADFRCPGPDETGLCAPVCPPCYWFQLGLQLKIYSAVVSALSRRRDRIEREIGSAACKRAQAMRKRLSRDSKLMAAFRTGHNGAHRNGRPPQPLASHPS